MTDGQNHVEKGWGRLSVSNGAAGQREPESYTLVHLGQVLGIRVCTMQIMPFVDGTR